MSFDQICLSPIVIETLIGILPEERVRRQRITVHVTLSISPITEDQIASTVDYGVVLHQVQDLMRSSSFFLIETLANAIASEILATHGLVHEAIVRIEKPEIFHGSPVVSVCVTRSRGA